MTKEILRWHPDTCKCEFYYMFDTDDPAAIKYPVTPEQAVSVRPDLWEKRGDKVVARLTGHVWNEVRCTDHGEVADQASHLATVDAENKAKNDVERHLAETVDRPGLVQSLRTNTALFNQVASAIFPGPLFHARLSLKAVLDEFSQNPEEGDEFVVAVVRSGYTWSFDSDRVLSVSHPALSSKDKRNVQQLVDSKFGHGHVTVK